MPSLLKEKLNSVSLCKEKKQGYQEGGFFSSKHNHDFYWCFFGSFIARLLSLLALCFLLKATYNLLI